MEAALPGEDLAASGPRGGVKEEIRDYAKLGYVHHTLYPDSQFDPDDHVETLLRFVSRGDMDTFDFCLPYGEERRRGLIRAIRACGKDDITLTTHLFPLRKIPLGSRIPYEQAQVRMIVADIVEQAAATGVTGLIFASGGPPAAEAEPEDRAAFRDFCRWLCGELKPHGVTALLEPFDTDVDKKFLYGPTGDCASLVESLRPGIDNFGIELDFAHLPLMGEVFEDAVRSVAPYLRRVHLGNCVFRDRAHPLYGDKHPPIGLPGGEIDVPELTRILRSLLDVGFLNRQCRGCMLTEMTPWPGKSVEETIADSRERLARAWDDV